MPAQSRVVAIHATSYPQLEDEVTHALRDLPPDRVITISYAVSRLLGLWLQHHALIVIRGE